LKKIKNKEASLYAGLLYLSGVVIIFRFGKFGVFKTMQQDK